MHLWPPRCFLPRRRRRRCSTTWRRAPTSSCRSPTASPDAPRRHRGRRRPPRRRPRPPDARAARPAVPARGVRRPPRHVSYFLSHVTRPVLPRRRPSTSCPNNFSEMRAILLTRHTTDPLVAGRGVAARPPRLLQPRGQRRLRGVVHRPGPVLPRGQPRRCPARSAATRSTSARSPAGPRPTTRWSRCRRRRRRRLDRRIAALVAERIPDGATIQIGIGAIPNAILAAARRPSRPRHPHRADLRRRRSTSSRRGVVTGVAKEMNRTKTVGTFALGTHGCYDFLDENTAFELWPVRYVNDPRVIAQEPDFVSINATIAGRPARPVRLGDRRRHLLLVERRPGRLRPRRDVLRRAARASSCCTPRHRTALSQDRRAARRRRRRDDAQEHRRQGRHRMGCGRAPRPLDPRAGQALIAVAHPDHRDHAPRGRRASASC